MQTPPPPPVQFSHGVILHDAASSPISNFKRSNSHSVYMLMVALVASLCPGPTLAARASAKLRHMPGGSVPIVADVLRGVGHTCGQVSSVLVWYSKPILQQATTLRRLGVGFLIERTQVRAISRLGDLRAKDDDVEILALPLIFRKPE